MSELLSLWFDLIDQQLVDADDLPIGRVEDLELALGDDGPPRVEAILTGTQALGERIEGVLARWLAAASARLREPASGPGPTRIPIDLAEHAERKVKLRVRHADLPHVAPLEHWLSERVIRHIPRADAGE